MIDWDLIRFIISLTGFILMILFIVKIKKRTKHGKSIKASVVLGLNCYSCKEHIDDDPLQEFANSHPNLTQEDKDEFFNQENFRMCTACKRDDTLNEVTKESKLSNFILKSKKYLYSKKSRFLPLYYIIIYFTFLLLDIFLKEQTRFFFYAYNVALFAYWYIIFKRIDLDYIVEK